jgi:hypothetical protein
MECSQAAQASRQAPRWARGWDMPKRSSKDITETAFAVVQQSIANSDTTQPAATKDPAAVALGRLGGLKGGKARAEKLSAKQKAAIARMAAKARWKRVG